jgi:hypothetical protein
MTSDDDHMNQHPNAAAARQRTGEDLAAGRALDRAARISRFKEMAARRGLTVEEQHDVLLGLGDAAAAQLQFDRDRAARRAEDTRIWGGGVRPLSDLPRVVQRVGVVPGVWLVGGAAAYVLGEGGPPKDWDFIVEAEAHGPLMAHLRAATLTLNSCGGLKVAAPGGVTLDIWISSLARFVTNGTGAVAVNLLHGKVVRW